MAGWPTVIIMLLSPAGAWAWAELGNNKHKNYTSVNIDTDEEYHDKYVMQTVTSVDSSLNSRIAVPEDVCLPGAKNVDLQYEERGEFKNDNHENNPNVKIDSDNETSTNYGHVDEGETESKHATVEVCEENNMKEDTDSEKVEFISDKRVGEKNPMLKTKSIDQRNVNNNLYNRNTGVVELVPHVCPHRGVCVHQHRAGVRAWPWDPGG